MAASTLREALTTFILRPLESEQDMKLYYVEHHVDVLERLAMQLQTRRRLKVLFTGHRITGKTTSLNRLSHQLGEQFFIIHLSVPEVLSITDVDYNDLMLALSLRLLREATAARHVSRGILSLVREELLEDILRWFSERLRGVLIVPSVAAEPSVRVRLNVFVAELEAKLSTEAVTRRALREQMSIHLSELIERMNYVVGEVERRSGRQVLFIVEDIDKLDMQPAQALFLNHARTLTAISASIIYTFPIALRYSLHFPQISANFDRHFMLPIVRIINRDGSAHPSGYHTLRRIFFKRINRELVADDALEFLAEASGGLIGMLIRLGLLSVEHALVDRKEQLDVESARKAVAEVRGDYKALLRAQDYEVLGRCLRGEELTNDESVQELLYTGALLEYHNHEPWIRLNPIVRPLVEARVT